ncbi:MAG: acyl carrier protein [Schleiferiaceae bacterium]|jgi:acyl carrier protein|nr:acyl carrier protein [Schleiferiaceae bacterium]
MTKEGAIEKINDFLIDEFEVDQEEITPNANMQEVLELDSLDYVDLVVVIESNFGFKLTAEDFKGISTFQDFYNLIYLKASAN